MKHSASYTYEIMFNFPDFLYQLGVITWGTYEPFIDLPAPTMVEQYAKRILK